MAATRCPRTGDQVRGRLQTRRFSTRPTSLPAIGMIVVIALVSVVQPVVVQLLQVITTFIATMIPADRAQMSTRITITIVVPGHGCHGGASYRVRNADSGTIRMPLARM